jgi:hypothetical protein
MTPERLDHMTVQYVWALENNPAFMNEARYEVDCGHFAQFRRIIGRFVMPIRKMLDEDHSFALSGVEWSFLYLEMWKRLGGACSAYGFSSDSNMAEFNFQLDRLQTAGYCYTTTGVQKRQDKNPCVEISLGASQPCQLNPEGELPMNDNHSKAYPCSTATLAPAFETKSYIFGNEVKNMAEEALIGAIKRVEEQIADLKAVKTKSTKIAANIAKLQEQLASIVAELDAR